MEERLMRVERIERVMLFVGVLWIGIVIGAQLVMQGVL
jgi:hypothetical protein